MEPKAEYPMEPERRVVVDDVGAQIVVYPDSHEERMATISGSSEEAERSYSFSDGQATFLAGLQTDFRRCD